MPTGAPSPTSARTSWRLLWLRWWLWRTRLAKAKRGQLAGPLNHRLVWKVDLVAHGIQVCDHHDAAEQVRLQQLTEDLAGLLQVGLVARGEALVNKQVLQTGPSPAQARQRSAHRQPEHKLLIPLLEK